MLFAFPIWIRQVEQVTSGREESKGQRAKTPNRLRGCGKAHGRKNTDRDYPLTYNVHPRRLTWDFGMNEVSH
jgi:hypothetical protein